MTTWYWDEIGGNWGRGKPSRVRIGEQDAVGWTRVEDEGRVQIFRSDSGQLGLELEALTAYDAHVIARTDCHAYREAVE